MLMNLVYNGTNSLTIDDSCHGPVHRPGILRRLWTLDDVTSLEMAGRGHPRGGSTQLQQQLGWGI